MFINISNHPYTTWDEKQRAAAQVYGECVDMPFPSIDPKANENDIERLAEDYAGQIMRMATADELTVHIMGEFTFSYALIKKLQQAGVRCVASCTMRDVTYANDGTKQVKFHFTRFREYME